MEVVGSPAEFYSSHSSTISIGDASPSTNVTINTADSSTHMTNGTLSIKVIRGDQYEPETTTPTEVIVLAKETLPKVSIADPTPNMIEEGEIAQFMVTAANPTPSGSLRAYVTIAAGKW